MSIAMKRSIAGVNLYSCGYWDVSVKTWSSEGDIAITISYLVGGWATPLKNMSSSIGMIRHSQY